MLDRRHIKARKVSINSRLLQEESRGSGHPLKNVVEGEEAGEEEAMVIITIPMNKGIGRKSLLQLPKLKMALRPLCLY